MFDFPSSPALNDIYDHGGITYVWNGYGWVVRGGTTDDYVVKTGDTMSGGLTIDTAVPFVVLNNAPADNTALAFWGHKNMMPRWNVVVGNQSPETGGNTGSDFGINRYDDFGVHLSSPLQIMRSTGLTLLTELAVTSPGLAQISLNTTTTDISSLPVIDARKNGQSRWSMHMGYGIETGANVGSDFHIQRGLDDGTRVNALIINRSNGQAEFFGHIKITGTGIGLRLNKTIAAEANIIFGETNSLSRWQVRLGDYGQELGGNTGSDFGIFRYSDASTFIDTPIFIRRNDGKVQMPNGAFSGPLGGGTMPGYPNSNNGWNLASNGQGAFSYAGGPALFCNINTPMWAIHFGFNGATVGTINCDAGATYYLTGSSADAKEDLKSFDAGRIIDETMVYDFAWKKTGERAYGVVAQEAELVYPLAVKHDVDEARDIDSWGVDYSKYVPVLLQELKALRKRVRELETSGSIKPQPTDTKKG